MDKEKVELQLKFTPNYKKYSILLNCYRVGGMKWNDVDGAIFHKIDLSKEDVLFALGVKQQIADLEAKLKESEKQCQECKHLNKKIELNIKNKLMAEINQLKQRLAEKDGELHQIYSHLGVEAFGEDIHEQALKELAEKESLLEKIMSGEYIPANIAEKSLKLSNQTAIVELEKLLDKTQTLDVMVQSGHYINQKKVNVVFTDTINQQIKSLKGEK